MAGRAFGAQGGVTDRALSAKLDQRGLTSPLTTRIAVFSPSRAASYFNTAVTPATGEGALPNASILGSVH